ncbi:hypothetical protein ACSBL2_24550 [Pedobacter sp. AW31-3R]|uniref:hypothetical protein n=1 Tax=Pedobacter sp. AW31-3R TaxID=3445781 RepID=UPI003FA0AACD
MLLIKITYLTALLFLTLLFSCKVIRPESSYTKTDSTSVQFSPVEVTVRGGKVGTSLSVDSLLSVYQAQRQRHLADSSSAVQQGRKIPPPPETEKQSFTDPETKAQLTYWIDKYGKLQLGCESKDQTVTFLTAEITRLSKEVSTQKELIKELPTWAVMLFGSLGVLLLLSILLNILLFKNQ